MAGTTVQLYDAVAGAAAAIAEHAPRVVVGSSYGGAVATKLLLDGIWSGPTVLIAPAARRLVAGAGEGVELWTIPGGDHRLNTILTDGTLARALEKLGLPMQIA